MKKILFVALLLVIAAGAVAQESRSANFSVLYNFTPTDANPLYCVVTGQGGNPWGPPIGGLANIKTVGSSTTISAVTAATLPFTGVAVGDIILVNGAVRTVATLGGDADSVVVDTAINLSSPTNGYSFGWKKTTCGATASDGWIDVAAYGEKKLTVQYDAGDIDPVSVRWECIDDSLNAQPVVIYPGKTDGCGGGTLTSGYCAFAAANVGITNRLSVVAYEPWSKCRIAFKAAGAEGGEGTVEAITASIQVRLTR